MILQTKPIDMHYWKKRSAKVVSVGIFMFLTWKGYDKTAFEMGIIYSVLIVLKLLDAWVCDLSKTISSK